MNGYLAVASSRRVAHPCGRQKPQIFSEWFARRATLFSAPVAALLVALWAPLFAASLVAAQAPADRPDAATNGIEWTLGPARVPLGDVADLELPAGYRFTDARSTRLLLAASQSIADGSELGAVLPPPGAEGGPGGGWAVLFYYHDTGHVPDDERDALSDSTASALLETIRRNTEQANVQARTRGWPEMNVFGWQQRPFYDALTHHLTWAVSAGSPVTATVVNYDSRILGRQGVIATKLVIPPDRLDATLPTYRMLVGAVSFRDGQRYQQFRSGDKVAQYGLTGLIAGGAAVVAVKSWKGLVAFGALVVAAVSAAAAKLKSWLARFWPRPALAGAGAGESHPSGGPSVDPAAEFTVIACPVCGQSNRVRNLSHEVRTGGHEPRPRCGRCKADLGGA